MNTTISSQFIQANNLKLHYLEAGVGDPVLLLHGWPTSSFLWRNIIPAIAAHNRVIALDLPGFGKSDKPFDAPYNFEFYRKTLDDFLAALRIEKIGLAIHDLGGPIGLYWAVHRRERVSKLAFLNTLVYPDMSWAVVAFVAACRIPGFRGLMASPWGLRLAMEVGMEQKWRINDELIAGVQAPFAEFDDRRALLKSAGSLEGKGFVKIARRLRTLKMPVRIIYGKNDRILPDVAQTMDKVAQDLPQAISTSLPDCGHFLQEDNPDEIGKLLADFFHAPSATGRPLS